MELKNLTAKQLTELVAAAGRRQTELAGENIATARARIQKILTDSGLSLDEVFGKRRGATGKTTRAKVAPKYRNPQDASQTWSGRGLKPRWMVAALKGG
jgi:DNA-binding protein H-NS